jgi:hypothetical protein
MKRAKRKLQPGKPRNPLAVASILKKGGAHARKDKKARRALLKQRARREMEEQVKAGPADR